MMMANLMFRELKLADLILIAFVIMGIVVSAVRFSRHETEEAVYIYKDNQLWAVYPLDKEQKVVIDEHNSLQISKGKVRMLTADCPDKRCIKQGWTSQLPIICLPNRLLIEVKSRETERKLILQ